MVKPTFNKNKAGEIISARIRVCDGYVTANQTSGQKK